MNTMANIVYFHSLFSIVTVVSIISFANFSPIKASNGGFSINLIHRDSPDSPLYNPSETPANRLNNAFQRSISRLSRLNPTSVSSNSAQSPVMADNGEYLMKLSIGTPPVDIIGIADTGSDLMWTQCLPCDTCYKQINPMFDPTKSSTYSGIPCGSQQCHILDPTDSCSSQPQKLCNYTYAYGDGSYTRGFLATETITFSSTSGQPVSLPNIAFGCGHNNSGGFNENEMGLIGLGGGPISLISQIGSLFGSKKFSQCLVPFHTDPSITSKINFGTDGEVSGAGVVSTPLVTKDDPTYYFVTLEGISVGDKFFPFNSSQKSSEGNVFIDSGTPPTILPQDFYNRLEQELRKEIPMEPVNDPDLGTQLCYRSTTVVNAPILTAHFRGSADIQLMPMNTFISPKKDVFCFAMAPTAGDTGIFGNFDQMNFLIGYDFEKMTVSFKPTDCTKQ